MILCVTLLILSGSVSVAERFKVIGPEEAVVADVGEDVVLPCSLQPNTSAEDMTVAWHKKDVIVHHYENHKDRNDEQPESYRGRTDLFKEELKNGDVSLKLSAVQLSDEGTYTCLVDSSSGPQSAAVDLKVRGVFTFCKIDPICISLSCFGLLVFGAIILKYSACTKSGDLKSTIQTEDIYETAK